MNDILIDTNDNGEIENVHLAPIGQYNGSDAEGNPIPENITVESLEQLATDLNSGDDVLCDVDHKSVKPGVEKDSRAAGWFSRFFVDPIRGLFASLKLTKYGRDLLENREYRYVSPTLQLDGNGVPVGLHSIALTNTPAFKGSISPILNSEPDNLTTTNEEKIVMEMTKDELVSLIKETVTAINSCPEKKDEVQNDEVKDEVKTEEVKDEVKTEEVKNEEVKTEEVKTEEVKTEEVKTEEVKNEEVKTEEVKQEEVIKIESLNSSPKVVVEPEWKKLHGKAFWDYCSKHPELVK